MSWGNYGSIYLNGTTNNTRRNAYIPASNTNVLDRGQSRNQIKGKIVSTTLQKPKENQLKSCNFPIQQEKRPQIAIQLPKKSISAQEGTVKTNKQVMEMLRVKQESFQNCIRAILQNNLSNVAINHSGFSQGLKYQLNRLKTTIIDLQKDKKQLQQIKDYIKWVQDRQNWLKVDFSKEWKTILGKAINDRKAIQECVIGNPIQYERINHVDHTEKGMNILKNLSKLSKLRQLDQKMRIQLETHSKQKYKNTNLPLTNHQNQSIEKVYESIKQHLASSLQEELVQQKKKSQQLSYKIKNLSRELESSKNTATFNAPTAADLYKSLQTQLSQLRKENDALQDRKNQQINKLKSEIVRLQQAVKETGNKQGSNSRIHIKETNNRQLQNLIRQRQAELTSQQQVNARLKLENEALKKNIDGLNEKLKKTVQQSSSVELGLKYTIKDYAARLKQYEAYTRKIQDEKKNLEEYAKQMQAKLAQKDPQITKLNVIIAQRDKQIHLLKSNQKQIKEQYDRIMKEKSGLQQDLKYQRQRGADQRKNSDASRQLLIKQRDELQRNLDKLQAQARQVGTSYKSLQIEHNQLKKKLENLQSSANRQLSSSQLKQTHPQIINLQNILKSKDKQIAELKSLSNSRSNSNEALDAQLNRLTSENYQQKQDIKALNLHLSSKARQLQQIKEDYKLVDQKMHQAQLSLKQSESKAVALQREKSELSSIISRHERSIKAKDEEIKELIHTSETLQQMMSEMADLKVNSSFSVEEKPQQSSKVIQLQGEISGLNKQIDYYKDIKKRLEAELKSKEARITELLEQQQRRDGELSGNIQAIQYQNSQLKNRMRQMQQLSRVNVDDQARIKALYQHQMLNDYYQYKLFLTDTLQEHYNRRIKRTKLIFYYDLLNKVNFHQYIDGVSSLLLIIKTASGMFLAGYTEGPFLRRSSDRDGLILSLTNRKYFTLMQHNRRAITYDEYYIIFGNSEIRLKSLENRVFSNFGISNGYYNSRGEKVTVLLGGGQHDREMDIETYEIYQVLFDDY